MYIFCRGLSRCGLIRLICQTLEFCWQTDVAACLVESLQHLVVDNEEYVTASDNTKYFALNTRACCSISVKVNESVL